jgi:hypothetical protein
MANATSLIRYFYENFSTHGMIVRSFARYKHLSLFGYNICCKEKFYTRIKASSFLKEVVILSQNKRVSFRPAYFFVI